MIVAATAEGGLRLITQPDHAHLAAEILRLWRADALPEHPRREELLFAVREHDNGWREADSAPRLAPRSGQPATFLTIADELRREIWERGVERHLAGHPFAAALIAEHALRLLAGRQGSAWEEFLEKTRKIQDEALERSALPRQALEEDYAWLRLADDISLWLCTGQDTPERPGRRGHRTADGWELDPFPFAGTTTFRVACRHVPAGPFRSDADLAVTLAAARWEEAAFRLRPVSPGPRPW